MRKSLWICLLLLLAPTLLLASSGVEGRVAWRGQVVPGLMVSAYSSLQEVVENRPLAVSQPSELDGTYQLDIPPGSYYLVARDFKGAPLPGNHFCYYSGSPVLVSEEGYRQVGFNLIKVPQEAQPQSGKRSGLKGRISFEDEPLEKAYLYIYKDYKKNFKGPAYYIQPVGKGDFRLSLPPGQYFVLARKRARGGQFGPVEIDDYFNYYYGNPIRIEKDQVRHIDVETIRRLSMLEEEEGVFQGVKGQVLGPDGTPQAGLRVFAYRQAAMTGMPTFFSSASDEQGRFELPIPEQGAFYLLARKSFGGPAGSGELYGKYLGSADHRVEVTSQQKIQEISIRVAPSL
jgi:hypothetical protein